MAKFHFVEDYEAHVEQLCKQYPLDQAMSLAVGGSYREIGEIERDILVHAGLRDGMSLVDVGCGSGRLAHVLSEATQIKYLGTDVIQALLNYAKSRCKKDYVFKLHRELSIPASAKSVDMVCAFSVFTHLLHEESYVYLEDIKRVLKPGGKLVFSFVEFAMTSHWAVFATTVRTRREGQQAPLNMFIERDTIRTWSKHLGFEVVDIIDGNAHPYGAKALGQSVAVLRNPS